MTLHLPDWLLALLAVLAVARVTRVVVEDAVADRARAWLLRHARPGGMLAYLIGCPWCVSAWAGGAVGAVLVLAGHNLAVQAVIFALGASQATGLLVPRTYPED